MKVKREKNAVSTIILGKEMTISHASDLRDQLLKELNKVKTLHVDMTSVSSLDISTLQLLCAAQKTATERDISFNVDNISNNLKNTINRAGFIRKKNSPSGENHCLWISED